MSDRLRPRVQLFFDDSPSLTKQEFRDECDVNVMMRRYEREYGADFLAQYQNAMGGHFGDFSQIVDYRTAIHQVSAAKGAFDALPAKLRARFRNDPAEFLDFVQNPANIDEMVSLGLAVMPESVPHQAVTSASDSLKESVVTP